MKVIDPGHEYELEELDGLSTQCLRFVKRFRGDDNHPGVICQEVLRALIHRTKFLDMEIPHRVNVDILKHLRLALVLYEARALERKVEKGELFPENVDVGLDGHFLLKRG